MFKRKKKIPRRDYSDCWDYYICNGVKIAAVRGTKPEPHWIPC